MKKIKSAYVSEKNKNTKIRSPQKDAQRNKSEKNAVTNLKKAKSLLEKVLLMSENNEYCIDIMQQNLAVIGLLKSAHLIMMENHLKTCFANALDSNKEELKQKMIGEILTVTKHSNK